MQHTICSVILARLGSSRLPHKAIKRFGDKTILDFILNRARNLDNWPNIILATTDLDEDDELEKLLQVIISELIKVVLKMLLEDL